MIQFLTSEILREELIRQMGNDDQFEAMQFYMANNPELLVLSVCDAIAKFVEAYELARTAH